MSPIRVLIVDDEPLFSEALEAVLSGDDRFEVVGRATTGEEAVARTPALAPDVVLMDITMPRMDGLEATRRLAAEAPACRVVVLTESDLPGDVVRAERAGAAGYVAKTRIGLHLRETIAAVAAT